MLAFSITYRRSRTLNVDARSDPKDVLDAISREYWNLGNHSQNERFLCSVFGTAGQPGTVTAVGRFVGSPKTKSRSKIVAYPLNPAHPLNRIVGKPHPSGLMTRNPIAYVRLEEEREPCKCGCGSYPSGWYTHFLPGHDRRALQDRIDRYFQGNVVKLIRELDSRYLPEEGNFL